MPRFSDHVLRCSITMQLFLRSQPKDRQDLVDTFQSNPSVRIALLGLTAAGIGITLTAASRCVPLTDRHEIQFSHFRNA